MYVYNEVLLNSGNMLFTRLRRGDRGIVKKRRVRVRMKNVYYFYRER